MQDGKRSLPPRLVVRGAALQRSEDRRGMHRGSGQKMRSRRASHRRLEQLPDDAEAEVAFQLPSPGAQHSHPRVAGNRAGPLDQRRLADPGWSLEQQDPAGPAGRGDGSASKRVQLAVALQQHTIRPVPQPNS